MLRWVTWVSPPDCQALHLDERQLSWALFTCSCIRSYCASCTSRTTVPHVRELRCSYNTRHGLFRQLCTSKVALRRHCCVLGASDLGLTTTLCSPISADFSSAIGGVPKATACQVLRLVLRNGREAYVSCSVQSDAVELLQGRIRGASVAGRGWTSRLGLTARSIDVDVGSVNLDVSTLFRRRVLQFQHPVPSGNARVVFNAQDFGNFLAHPLIRRTSLAGRSFVFDRHGVAINPVNRTLAFGGRWGEERLRVALSQASARDPLVARVVRGVGEEGEGGGVDETIGLEMSSYFNNLEVDLDGPTLSFSSLSFEGNGVESGRIKLALGIVVRKLPSIRAVASF